MREMEIPKYRKDLIGKHIRVKGGFTTHPSTVEGIVVDACEYSDGGIIYKVQVTKILEEGGGLLSPEVGCTEWYSVRHIGCEPRAG